MKTATINLNKECLLVELNPELKEFRKNTLDTLEYEGWTKINLLSELTDEDVIPLLKIVKNYGTRNDKPINLYEHGGGTFIPIKAFFSALEAEGLFLNGNPIELIPRGEASEQERVNNQNDWHEAQQRTFDKNRTILLVKN